MKQYTDRLTAPLRFHYLYMYTLIPMNILSLLYELFYIFTNNTMKENAFHLVYDFTALLLLASTFAGFLKLKKYGFYTLIGALLLGVFFIWYQMIFCIINHFSAVSMILTDFMIIHLKTGIVFFYYFRRRKLFR